MTWIIQVFGHDCVGDAFKFKSEKKPGITYDKKKSLTSFYDGTKLLAEFHYPVKMRYVLYRDSGEKANE